MIRILSIETSCDETAISVLEADGGTLSPKFKVLGNALASQAELHAQYGGVFPMVAKREHGKIITELTGRALTEANVLSVGKIDPKIQSEALAELDRDPEARENLAYFFQNYGVPDIDLICVTSGPGLEPALWVGISFAKALAIAWKKPVMPVNHMEGHIVSVLLQKDGGEYKIPKIIFPAVAILVSGGHTEIHEVKTWNNYRLLGATKDDAVGEAFDKAARMLGLSYPGGPKISALAKEARDKNESFAAGALDPVTAQKVKGKLPFPRPMISTDDFNFSYSGLKTAMLYLVRDLGEKIDSKTRRIIAREFEEAALEVVVRKAIKAAKHLRARSIILGGGVAANHYLRDTLSIQAQSTDIKPTVYFPGSELSTDNSLMIAMAGYFSYLRNNRRGVDPEKILAVGNLKIGPKIAASNNPGPQNSLNRKIKKRKK